MFAVPESPVPRRVKKPTWLDLRLILGCLLVLCSVVLGAKVVAGADHTVPVVALATAVDRGTVLTASEVRTTRARLPASAAQAYLADVHAAIGMQVNRPMSRGELLPRASLDPVVAATTVTIPFSAGAAPTLTAGQRITVWLSAKACPAALVLSGVAIQDVRKASGGSFSSSGEQDVVVRVSPDLAERVVTALAQDGAVLRAGVTVGEATGPAPSALPALPCGRAGGG